MDTIVSTEQGLGVESGNLITFSTIFAQSIDDFISILFATPLTKASNLVDLAESTFEKMLSIRLVTLAMTVGF
ncbi:ORF988 [White spot syndrome virus]|uniref:ORF988 n=1 Tax=White spot syndrome virus TaxID=342409 RepID=A0A2D3I6F2_9VIRU|nr:ORF988 [White spot syndrome virus]